MGRVILITGGTGTLGQGVTRDLLDHWNPESIRIYSRGEHLQWQMKRRFNDERLRFLIGDVRDKDRLSRAMNGVEYVIHCAALKHVSFCEYNPMEAVKTNVLGGMNVIDCCIDNGVKRCLAVSSDKAVHPANLYGSTKLAEEHLFKNGNVYGPTKFAVLRPGNFTESRGNVLEAWSEQSKTGTLTITDPNMTRFFIPVERVANLLSSLLFQMKGGEIFIPKAESQSIYQMAQERYPSCTLAVIGKGEGEKMHELLFAEGEYDKAIEHDDYWELP